MYQCHSVVTKLACTVMSHNHEIIVILHMHMYMCSFYIPELESGHGNEISRTDSLEATYMYMYTDVHVERIITYTV